MNYLKHPRLKQFVFGVSAGLTAQALRALWQWLRSPVTAAPPKGR